ncbi:MAG: nickel-dependent malate racemase, LarAH6 family [Candidatus Helarchaeales archaeon]
MVDFNLKYGSGTIPISIPDENFVGELLPSDLKGVPDALAEIERALDNPINSKKIEDLVHEKVSSNGRIVILADDYTRGTPAHLMIPPILDRLNSAGVPDSRINVIFATGTHRPTRPDEAELLLGKKVIERVSWEDHDCNASDLVSVGTSSFGNEIKINRKVAEADLIIATGAITFHYYAGFGGGRKSILPGISSKETITRNHGMLIHPKAVTGNLEGNPVHEEMVEAARMAGLDFIINLIKNGKGEIVRAVAGDFIQAHAEGVKLYDKMFRVKVSQKPDIVIVSAGGYPKDINLYQATKAIDNAKFLVKKGGVIIAALECKDGIGNAIYTQWSEECKRDSIEKTWEILNERVKNEFVMGGHKAYYIASILRNASIILVSSLDPREVKEKYWMTPAPNLEKALEMAFNMTGSKATVMVMPLGSYTLPKIA